MASIVFCPSSRGTTSPPPDAVKALFDYTKYITYDSALTEKEGVKNVQVANTQGSFEIVYSIVEKGPAKQRHRRGGNRPSHCLERLRLRRVTFDSDTLQYLVGDLLKVIYTAVYTSDADGANSQGVAFRQECGFDSPTATLTANFNDGKSYTIYIGSELPTKGSYYLMQEGDSTIYIAKSSDVDYFLRGLPYFVSKQMVPALDIKHVDSSYFANDVLSRFDKITVSGSNFAKPLVFEMADSAQIAVPTDYRMTSPEARAADTDRITTLLAPLANGWRPASAW